ncbi:BTAD domain-containing putative transcriptional regulator [Candidatus Bipolaricaulota bacterium]
MNADHECSLQIKTLGGLEVSIDGEPIAERLWPRRKTKNLLKVLLSAPGDIFTVDQLIEALWEDSFPASAARNVQSRVSELRRVLEPGLQSGSNSKYIQRVGEGYLLCAGTDLWIDAISFEISIAEGHAFADRDQWDKAVDAFEEALTLYQGDFLAEDRYVDWTDSRRSHIRDLRIDALSRQATCYAEMSRLRQAISCCQLVLKVEPYRESAVRQLMEYQDTAGQRAQALGTYTEGKRALSEYLGVEPSTETRSLHERIRNRNLARAAFDPRWIAVLPLANYSSDPEDEYLADGMTEELIGSLAKIRDLRVIARTSVMRFKGTVKSVAQIARELNVGTVLEGSVRKIGKRIRITAQLIDASTEHHLWADHYSLDLEDMLQVQGEIAWRVTEALKVELLTGEETALREAVTGDAGAHIAYLKGRHFLEQTKREALEHAISCFEEALHRDPNHARALTGLADVYCRIAYYTNMAVEEAFAKARELAMRALALDGALAEAHRSLATIACRFDGDMGESERLLCRAVALDPSYALAQADLAILLTSTDRNAEALKASEAAIALDPLSAQLISVYAGCLYSAARFHEAIEQARKAIELDPELHNAWFNLFNSIASTWDWDRAEAVLREMITRFPRNPYGHAYLGRCVQWRGRREEGLDLVEKAAALPGAMEKMGVVYNCGVGYFLAGEYNQAERLFRKILERFPGLEAARVMLAKCYSQRERFDEALEGLDVAEKEYGIPGEFWLSHVRFERGRIYALRGETKKAEAELAQLTDGTSRNNRRMAASVLLYVLGRVDEALQWAEDAVNAREPYVNVIRISPEIPDSMREHPRFQALLKRVGLADS